MKLCYVADGASIHTKRWLNYLVEKGYDVHLICWKASPGFDARVSIHLLKSYASKIWWLSQYANFIYWCFQVRTLVRGMGPDIVDGHFVTTYGFIASTARFHPLVVTAWGSDVLILPKKNPIYRFTAEYAMKKADAVVCTGPAVGQEISKMGVDPNKTHVIVLGGVDKDRFRPVARDEAFMENLGIGPEQPVVISTRSLAPVYDIETLLEAVPVIVSKFPRTRFLIVGRGKQEDHLQKLAARLGVQQSVKFTGWVDHGELPRYLGSSDIYVSTSLSDGTSNSLLEAMACGLAPVVSDIPANRQWIQESENGCMFPVGDYVTLAEKVMVLLGDNETRMVFGRKSRSIIELKADPETEMRKLANIYNELAA